MFRGEFLSVGGQEEYFLVSIKILICPNRTCKNRSTDKVVMAKMNFVQGIFIVNIKRHDVGPFQKYTSLQLKLFACAYHKYAIRQCYISF